MIINLIISIVLLVVIVIYAIHERLAEHNEIKEAYKKYLKEQTNLQHLLVKQQKEWK